MAQMKTIAMLFNILFEPRFYAPHEAGGCNFQSSAELEEHSDTGAAFAQFQQADVVTLNASIQSKSFLRKLALSSHCAQHITKCLFWIQTFCPINRA